MNTYDPSDRILYVHMSGPAGARSAPADSATAGTVLPSGYAYQSPRTRLPRRPAHVRQNRAAVASLTAWTARTRRPRQSSLRARIPCRPARAPSRSDRRVRTNRVAAAQPFGVTAVFQEAPGTQQSGSPRAAVRLVQELAPPDRAAAATEGEGGRPTFCPRRVSSPEPSRSVPRLPGDAAYQPLGTRPFCIGGSGDVRSTPALAEGE